MGRHVLEVKGYTPDDIKALFRKDERYTIGLRLYAVYQVSLGTSSRKLEDLYNTSFKQITNWVHRFEEQGIDGLRDKPGRGRKSLLTQEQSDHLRNLMLNESPVAHGYNTETWTGPMIQQYISNKFGINYKKAQVYNIIKLYRVYYLFTHKFIIFVEILIYKVMGRHVLEVKGYTPDDIKALFRKDERYTIGLRLYAVYQVSLGTSSRKLEDLYNTSFKQITNWVHRFEEQGIDGLRDKPGRGRKSLLTQEQSDHLRNLMLNESPVAHGYNTETWTGPMIQQYISNKFGINYKKAQVYNIIKLLGFSYQKGKATYPEAQQQAKDEFSEVLKKTL